MHTVEFSNSLCSAPCSLCGAQFARFPPDARTMVPSAPYADGTSQASDGEYPS